MLGLFLLAVGATLATVVFEAAWYGLVNGIDPMRVLAANIDPDLMPRPAQKVLVASLAVIAIVAGRRGFLAAGTFQAGDFQMSSKKARE